MLGELGVVPTSEVNRREVTSASEARDAFDADYAVEGSIYEDSGRRRLLMKLIDTAEMRQVDSYRFEGPADNAWSLQDNALARLAVMLDLESRPDRVAEQPVPKPGAHGFYLVGNGYLQRNDKMENINSAITVFGRALEIDPDYAPAHAGLAEAYWYKFERTSAPQWLPMAVDHADRSLELNPTLAKALYTRGSVRYGQGKYADAIGDLRAALELEPSNIEMHIGLAKALNKYGEKSESESVYQRGLAVTPYDWRLHKQLGMQHFQDGQYDQATVSFEEVVRLSPDNSQGFLNLGSAYYFLGRIADAEAAWRTSVRIKPRDAALSNLATLLLKQGKNKDAAELYEQAAQLEPNDFRTVGNLATAYRTLNHEDMKSTYQRAYSLAKTAFAVNTRRTEIPSYLALFVEGAGRYKDAERWLRIALGQQSPHVGEALRNAATAEYLGQRDVALDILLPRVKDRRISGEEVSSRPAFQELVNDERYLAILNQ